MRIALLGYGKMGQLIDRLAQEQGHTITHRIATAQERAALTAGSTDVVIEFTQPNAALGNIEHCLQAQLPMVVGTTGWLHQLKHIEALVAQLGGALMYASNFSVGVNVLFQLNKQLAQLMARFPQYDAYLHEAHHAQKKDAPSGTALTLAQQLLAGLPHKNKLALPGSLNDRPPAADELAVSATRAGSIPGTHSVTYHSSVDELTISHRAFSREGFALGAIQAAERIVSMNGLHNFTELFEL